MITKNNNGNDTTPGGGTPGGNLYAPASLQPARRIRTEAEQDNPPPGPSSPMQPNMSTENVLGMGCDDMNRYICSRKDAVLGFSAKAPGQYTFQIDYPIVGTIGQARAAYDVLYILGKNVADPSPLTVAGAVATAGFGLDDPAAPWNGAFPWSLGFRIDWGVAQQFWSAFDLRIMTTNWLGMDSQSLDRQLSMRDTEKSSGVIYVPWAMRELNSMAQALMQIARPLPLDNENDPQSLIQVIDLPDGISDAISLQVSFITAGSPQAADYARAIGLYGQAPQSA